MKLISCKQETKKGFVPSRYKQGPLQTGSCSVYTRVVRKCKNISNSEEPISFPTHKIKI